jgi:hypothetical protein
MVCDGDIVRTHTGAWGKVKKAWSRAFDGIVYKFSTEAGQFELTGEHPVLLARGWVKAEEIQVGDQVVYAQADALFDSSLPLGSEWGTAPRNAGVGRVMTPPQARLYYTTVGEIGTRHYAGRVYNMSVDGDNSYTVNGACVHNCLCRLRWVLAPDSDAIIDEMRARMARIRRHWWRWSAAAGGSVRALLLDDVQEAELAWCR